MNIKEIARLAEVSVSTVSKIINAKDQSISDETRERVLRIVREYNYSPYSGIRSDKPAKSYLLGIVINGTEAHEQLLTSMVATARETGYTALVSIANNAQEELKSVASLCAHNVDGIVWDRQNDPDPACGAMLAEHGVPYQLISGTEAPSPENAYIDYQKLGYFATQALIQNKHQHILCLVENDSTRNKRFIKGFEQCLYDNKIPFDAKMVWAADKHSPEGFDVVLFSFTGVVCSSVDLACMAYEKAASKNRKIPNYLSVVSLSGSRGAEHLFPVLSTVELPLKALGEYACKRLIEKAEHKRVLEVPFDTKPCLDNSSSIDVPITLRNKKIVVVGAMNMDTLITLGKFPQMGETVITKQRAIIPGGKGINQAIGAAKLGAEVYLIGKIGKDYEGGALYDFLQVNGVNVEGISSDSKATTGHAYVYVQDDGESGIVIYGGANSQLSTQEIEYNERLFENASFCLLQTEIEIQTVEYAAKTAKKYDARVLLKPAAVDSLSEELLHNVDILLPNRNEINRLYPGEASLETKAQYFLDRGVRTVIITLGHQGCYWRDKTHSEYFSAANFTPVDTTGAADAFAATLAVYLSRSYEMAASIRYATYAAGFSITRRGVPPSLIDRNTLELYLSDI